MAKWQDFEADILKIEGGYQNNTNDLGNYVCAPNGAWAKRSGNGFVCAGGGTPNRVGTKYGIAGPTWSDHIGRMATVADMQGITKPQAANLLKNQYWLANRIDEIDSQALANILCDFCINHGSNGAIKMMQRVLNEQFGQSLVMDGAMGSKTLGALNSHNPHAVHNAYRDARIDWYNAQRGTANGGNVDGWLNRMNDNFPPFIGDMTTAPSSAGWLRHWLLSVPASLHSAEARKEALALLALVCVIGLMIYAVYRSQIHLKFTKKLRQQ